MITKSLSYFFILSIAAITCYGHATYHLDQDGILMESRDGKNCTRAGFMCDDCSISSNCYQLPNGTWVKERVENCTASYLTCLESTGMCTAEPNKDCPILPVEGFICSQPGIFPDPFDCAKYHICTPSEDKFEDNPMQCDPGLLYDPLTTVCSRKVSSNCTLPIPRCTNVTTGPVLGNPSMYYQCVSIGRDAAKRIFAPRLYLCPPDHRFMKHKCHDVKVKLGVATNICYETNFLYRPGCNKYNYCSTVDYFAVPSSCSSLSFLNHNLLTCVTYGCENLML